MPLGLAGPSSHSVHRDLLCSWFSLRGGQNDVSILHTINHIIPGVPILFHFLIKMFHSGLAGGYSRVAVGAPRLDVTWQHIAGSTSYLEGLCCVSLPISLSLPISCLTNGPINKSIVAQEYKSFQDLWKCWNIKRKENADLQAHHLFALFSYSQSGNIGHKWLCSLD